MLAGTQSKPMLTRAYGSGVSGFSVQGLRFERERDLAIFGLRFQGLGL